MNEQIMKERRQTQWLILAMGLGLVLMVGMLVSLSIQSDSSRSDTGSVSSLPRPLTSTVLTIPETSGLVVVGQSAPDFTLETLDHQPVTLADLRGKVVIINFWASWCAPCRLEMPALQQAYEAYQGKGVVILAVNLTAQDAIAEAEKFVQELGLTFPILLDEVGEVSEAYQVLGLPTTIFVNREGDIARTHLGPMTETQIEQFVTELLN